MKKKIGFVSMDSVLAKWLLEKLIQEPPESDCAADLLSGMHDMRRGNVTAFEHLEGGGVLSPTFR